MWKSLCLVRYSLRELILTWEGASGSNHKFIFNVFTNVFQCWVCIYQTKTIYSFTPPSLTISSKHSKSWARTGSVFRNVKYKYYLPLNVFIHNVEMFIFLLESIILIWKVCLYYYYYFFLFKIKVYIAFKNPQSMFYVHHTFKSIPPAVDVHQTLEKIRLRWTFPVNMSQRNEEKERSLIYISTGAQESR